MVVPDIDVHALQTTAQSFIRISESGFRSTHFVQVRTRRAGSLERSAQARNRRVGHRCNERFHLLLNRGFRRSGGLRVHAGATQAVPLLHGLSKLPKSC